jgi:hypothetical protein
MMKYLFIFYFLIQQLFCSAQNDTMPPIPIFGKKLNMTISTPIYENGKITFFAAEQDTSKTAELQKIMMDTCGNLLKITKTKIASVKLLELTSRYNPFVTPKDIAIKTSDNGYLVSGFADDKIITIKLDSLGNIQFTYKDEYRQIPIRNKELKDGYMMIIQHYPDPDPPSPKAVLLTKLDKQGKKQWSYWYRLGIYLDFEELNDSTYLLMESNQEGEVRSYHINIKGNIVKETVQKCDENISSAIKYKNKWITNIGKWVIDSTSVYYREELAILDSNFKLLGKSNIPFIDKKTKQPFNLVVSDIIIDNNKIYVKILYRAKKQIDDAEGLIVFDTLGNILWMRQNVLNPPVYFTIGNQILLNGTIIGIGISPTDKHSSNTYPIFIKYNAKGQSDYSCSKVNSVAYSFHDEEPEWIIYPNPNRDYFELRNDYFNNDEKITLTIYDMLGRIKSMQSINNVNARIDTSNWEAGIYVYNIKNSYSKPIQIGKWIKIE